MTLGKYIQTVRVGHSRAQREVAERIGITPQELNDIEHDRAVPSKDVLERLAKTYRMSAEHTAALLARLDTKPTPMPNIAVGDLVQWWLHDVWIGQEQYGTICKVIELVDVEGVPGARIEDANGNVALKEVDKLRLYESAKKEKPMATTDIAVVPLTDENRPGMAAFALSMYANEPCRICRCLITVNDLHTAVFAGYSRDETARAAHKVCWDNFVELLQTLPVDRIHQLMNGANGEEL